MSAEKLNTPAPIDGPHDRAAEFVRAPHDLEPVWLRSRLWRLSVTVLTAAVVMNSLFVTPPRPRTIAKPPSPMAGYVPPAAEPLISSGEGRVQRSPLSDGPSSSPLLDNAPARTTNTPALVVPKRVKPTSSLDAIGEIRAAPERKSDDRFGVAPR